MTTRRLFIQASALFVAARPHHAIACWGDVRAQIFDVGPGSLKNIRPLDIEMYLKSLIPSVVSESTSLEVSLPKTGGPVRGHFVIDFVVPAHVAMANLSSDQRCSSIRLFYNINYFGIYSHLEKAVPSFCFEVGEFKLGAGTLPEITAHLKYYGPQGALFAVAIVEAADGSVKAVSSNVVRFIDVCGYGPLLRYVST